VRRAVSGSLRSHLSSAATLLTHPIGLLRHDEHERKAAATAIWADAMRETGRDPDMVVTDAVKIQDESPDDVVIQDGQTGGAGSGAGGWGTGSPNLRLPTGCLC